MHITVSNIVPGIGRFVATFTDYVSTSSLKAGTWLAAINFSLFRAPGRRSMPGGAAFAAQINSLISSQFMRRTAVIYA